LNDVISTMNIQRDELNKKLEEKEEKAKKMIKNINDLKKEMVTINENFESLCKILSDKQEMIEQKMNINSNGNNIKFMDNSIKEKYLNLCLSLSGIKEKYSKINNQIEHMVSQSNSFNVPIESQLRKLQTLKDQINLIYNQIIDKKSNKKEFYEKLYMLDIKLFNFKRQKIQLNKALVNINNQYKYENGQLESHLAAINAKLKELDSLDFNDKNIQDENKLKSVKEQLKIQQDELKNDMITIEKQSSEESKMLNSNIEEIQNEYKTIEKKKVKYSKKELLQKIKELTDIYEKDSISMVNQTFVLDSEQQERVKINSELNEIIHKLNEFILLFEKINQNIINNKKEYNSLFNESNHELDNNTIKGNLGNRIKNDIEEKSININRNSSEIKGIIYLYINKLINKFS